MSRWAWLATIAISCGHPSAPATPGRGNSAPVRDAGVDAGVALENDLPRLAQRAVKLYADWKAALDEAGTDCAVATTKMNAIADANRDVIEANRNVLRGSRERVKALRAELDKYQAELDASAKAIATSPAISQCSKDPAFARSFDRLGGEG